MKYDATKYKIKKTSILVIPLMINYLPIIILQHPTQINIYQRISQNGPPLITF